MSNIELTPEHRGLRYVGAPLTLLLLILLLTSVWNLISAINGRSSGWAFLWTVVLAATIIFIRGWTSRMWDSRWERKAERRRRSELFGLWVSFGCSLACAIGILGLPTPAYVAIIAIQLTVSVITSVLTLRKYPGLTPNKEVTVA